MRLSISIIFASVLSVSFAENDGEAQLYTLTQPHMGTEFTLRVWASEDQGEALAKATTRAFQRVEELNQICSDYLPESEINRFAKAPAGQPVELSPDLFRLFSIASEISKDSDGAFDITAGPFIRLWRLSRKNRVLPTEAQIDSARTRTGSHLLLLDPAHSTATKLSEGMLFDLGGIAKGYAADEALRILRDSGFPIALVAASGDVVVGDPPPGRASWKVEINTFAPNESESEPIVVFLKNAAVSTSGDRRQYIEIDGKRFSHIVSTRSGLGLTERIAASVIAPSATLSDSFATTVTLLGKKEGLQFIENKREIECRIVALHEGQEDVVTSHGFSQFKEEEISQESALTPP